MMDSPYEINSNSEKRYMAGKINLIIRLYFYFQEGVNQMTGLRALGYALIGLAGVFAVSKTEANYWALIIGIGIVSVPLFVLIGYVWVMRGKKSTEYYQVKYTSPWSKYSFELNERQTKLLEDILVEIKKLNK